MAAALNQAEKWRAHREAFALALDLGITPREAEAELRRRRAWQKLEHTRQRAAAKAARTTMPVLRQAADEQSAACDPQPWMMRD